MTTAITTTTITTTKLVKEDSRTKGWSILSLNINDIIVIKNPYKVIKLRVLRGVIDIIGALLYPSNKIYKIGPSAPTISLINIKAIEEGNNGKKEYISNTYKKEYPVIIALSDIKDIIYYNNNIIRKCNNGYRIFNIPIEWYNTIDYIIKKCYNNNIIKVMVIGGKGCGKSSFIKCCINRILTKKERLNIINNKVRVIDLDCGQPDISLPGTITLYDYVDISLSPSPTSLIKTIPTTPPALKEYNNLLHYELYTGGITPSLNPIDYINKCYKLIDMAMLYSNSEDSSIPIIINTPGWFSGLGGHILTLLRYYIKPDIVINIGKNNILDNNYWYDLCNGNNPLLLSQGYILSITREEEEGLYGKDIILPSVIKDNNNNIISSSSSKAPAAPPAAAAAAARAVVVGLPKSADLRWLRYTCYFNNNIIGRPYLWHTIIPSKCFNINNNNIKLLHINNINSIKILENDNIIDIIDINNRLDGVLVALLDNNGYLLCQGVIHNIDNNNNMINVWIPSKYNNNVNNNVICYIVKGNINWSLRESSYYTSTNNNTRLCIENERYFLPYTLKNEPIGRVCNPRTDLKRRRLQQ